MARGQLRRQPQQQPQPHPQRPLSHGNPELDPPPPPPGPVPVSDHHSPQGVLFLMYFPHLAPGLALLERGRRVLPTPPRPPPPLKRQKNRCFQQPCFDGLFGGQPNGRRGIQQVPTVVEGGKEWKTKGGREARPWLQGRGAHRVLMRWTKGCSLSGELMIWENTQEQC